MAVTKGDEEELADTDMETGGEDDEGDVVCKEIKDSPLDEAEQYEEDADVAKSESEKDSDTDAEILVDLSPADIIKSFSSDKDLESAFASSQPLFDRLLRMSEVPSQDPDEPQLLQLLTTWLPQCVAILMKRTTADDVEQSTDFFIKALQVVNHTLAHDKPKALVIYQWIVVQENPFYQVNSVRWDRPTLSNTRPTVLWGDIVQKFFSLGIPRIIRRIELPEPKVSMEAVKFLLNPIVLLARTTHSSVVNLQSVAETLQRLLLDMLRNYTDEELKLDVANNAKSVVGLLESLCLATSVSEETRQVFPHFRREFSLKCLLSPFLIKRLEGMAMINEFVRNARDAEELVRSSSFGDKDDQQVSAGEGSLAIWLKQVKIMEILYGPTMHLEVLKRSADVVKYLLHAGQLSVNDVLMMWDATIGKHETIRCRIYDDLAELVGQLDYAHLDGLYQRIAQLPVAEYDIHLLKLLHNIGIPGIELREKYGNDGHWFGLTLMFPVLLDCSGASKALIDYVLSSYSQYFRWFKCHTQRPVFIQQCLQHLKVHDSVPQMLQTLKCILSTYEKAEASSSGVEDTFREVANFLNNPQNNFSELFYEDLRHFARLHSPKSPRKDILMKEANGEASQGIASRYTVTQQVEVRLDFLQYFLTRTGKTLTIKEIDIIFDCLVLQAASPEAEQLALEWLSQGAIGIAIQEGASLNDNKNWVAVISNEGAKHLLFERCPDLYSPDISAAAFDFFRSLFVLLNELEGGLEVTRSKSGDDVFEVRSNVLLGFDMLFRIAVRCKSSEVARKSSLLLIELQKNFSANLLAGGGNPRELFLNACLQFLARSVDNISSSEGDMVRDSNTSVLVSPVDGVMRCVNLLLHVLRVFEPARGMSSENVEIFLTGVADDKIPVMSVKSSMLLGHLRKSLSESVPYSAQQVRILWRGKELVDDGKSLVELGFRGEEHVQLARRDATTQPPAGIWREGDALPEEQLSAQLAPSNVLAKQESFELFFRMLSQGIAVAEVWELLHSLPVHAQVLDDLTSLTKPWSMLLDTSSVFRLAYVLRVVLRLLQDGGNWESRFIAREGVHHVFGILCDQRWRVSFVQSSQERECLEHILHVIQHFLIREEDGKEKFCMEKVASFTSKDVLKIFMEILNIASCVKEEHIALFENGERVGQTDDDLTIVDGEDDELEGSNRYAKIANVAGKLLTALVRTDSSSLEALREGDGTFQQWLISTLLLCECDILRNVSMRFTLLIFLHCGLTPVQKSLIVSDLQSILRKLKNRHQLVSEKGCSMKDLRDVVNVPTAEHFFGVCIQILPYFTEGVEDQLDDLFSMLLVHPVIEAKHSSVVDNVGLGVLLLTKALLAKFQSNVEEKVRQWEERKETLLKKIFWDFLFQLPSKEQNGLHCSPIAKTQPTRNAAMRLLLALCSDSADRFSFVAENLTKYIEGSGEGAPWNYLPEAHERTSAFGGLHNLGATCYMNSLIQQFYMTPFLRYHLFTVDAEKENSSSDNGSDDMEVGEKRTRKTHDLRLLQQLQRLFGFLQESEKKAMNTWDFFESYRAADGSANAYTQMDADEFLKVFCDRLEVQLKTSQCPKILDNYFGGTLSHQIKSKECTHTTEREETFLSLSVDVKGKENIYESLDAFIQQDILDGDNKYHCEKCDTKVAAAKGCCLKTLPNTLIVHLKRFDFDMETFLRRKLNDYCTFPMELNLLPYTKDAEELKGKELSAEERHRYEYTLVGVVVHSGTADSGHYYSFIKDRYPPLLEEIANRRSQEKWYQFNDSRVEPFDTNDIEGQWFGGSESSYNSSSKKKVVYQRNHSAYMLFYEKRDRFIAPLPRPVPIDAISAASFVPESVYDEIWEENERFLKDKNLYDHNFALFLNDLCVHREEHIVSEHSAWEALCLILNYVNEVYVHSKDRSLLDKYYGTMHSICHLYRQLGKRALQLFVLHSNWLKRNLFYCTSFETRSKLSTFLLFLTWNSGENTEVMPMDEESTTTTADDNLPHQGDLVEMNDAVIDLLTLLLSLLESAKECWKNMEQYFEIFYAVARSGRSARDWLRSQNVTTRFYEVFEKFSSNNFQPRSGQKRKKGTGVVAPPSNLLSFISIMLRECRITEEHDSTPYQCCSEDEVLVLPTQDELALVDSNDFYISIISNNVDVEEIGKLIRHLIWKNPSRSDSMVVFLLRTLFKSLNENPPVSLYRDLVAPFLHVLEQVILLPDDRDDRIEKIVREFVDGILRYGVNACGGEVLLEFLVRMVGLKPEIALTVYLSKDAWLKPLLIDSANCHVRDQARHLVLGTVDAMSKNCASISSSNNSVYEEEMINLLIPFFPDTPHLETLKGVSSAFPSIHAFHYSSYFHLLRELYNQPSFSGLFSGLLEQCTILFVTWDQDTYRLQSDENKGALTCLMYHHLTLCPGDLETLGKNTDFLKNIMFCNMTASVKVLAYNHQYIPPFLGIVNLLLEHCPEFPQICVENGNSYWMLSSFLMNSDYPFIEDQLVRFCELLSTYEGFRAKVFNDCFTPQDHISQGAVRVLRLLWDCQKGKEQFLRVNGIQKLSNFLTQISTNPNVSINDKAVTSACEILVAVCRSEKSIASKWDNLPDLTHSLLNMLHAEVAFDPKHICVELIQALVVLDNDPSEAFIQWMFNTHQGVCSSQGLLFGGMIQPGTPAIFGFLLTTPSEMSEYVSFSIRVLSEAVRDLLQTSPIQTTANDVGLMLLMELASVTTDSGVLLNGICEKFLIDRLSKNRSGENDDWQRRAAKYVLRYREGHLRYSKFYITMTTLTSTLLATRDEKIRENIGKEYVAPALSKFCECVAALHTAESEKGIVAAVKDLCVSLRVVRLLCSVGWTTHKPFTDIQWAIQMLVSKIAADDLEMLMEWEVGMRNGLPETYGQNSPLVDELETLQKLLVLSAKSYEKTVARIGPSS